MSAIITLLLFLNFGISWFNAWSVGRGWAETRAAGGFARFMSWCGAIMSASGFTWCYLVLITLIGQAIPGKYHLPDKYAQGIFALGYLVIILPVLGSGIAITVQSWMYFWRQRNFSSAALATYNTFADIYNIYEACSAIPDSLSVVSNIFDGDDEDGSFWSRVVIGAVIVAVLGGILTTTVIVRTTARRVARSMTELNS